MSSRVSDVPLLPDATRLELVFIAELGLLLGVLVNIIARYIGDLGQTIARPYAVTYTGGLVSALARRPDIWFEPLHIPPHMPTIYPPVGLAVYGFLGYISPLPMPMSARIIGHAFAIGTALLIGAIAFRLSDRPLAAALAFGFYFFAPAVFRVSVHSRVDHAGMFFGMLAILLYAWGTDTAFDRRTLFSITIACVLSVSIKQSFVLFPFVIILALLLNRKYDTAISLFVYLLLTGLIVLASLIALFGHSVFSHLLVFNAVQPWRWSYWQVQILYILIQFGVVLTAAWYVLLQRTEWTVPPVMISLIAISTVFVVLTVGKLGAWIGYAYPLLAGASVVVAVWAVAWASQEAKPGWKACTVALLLLTQGAVYANWGGQPAFGKTNQASVAELVDGREPVLSEDASLPGAEPADLLVLQYASWDESSLIRRIEYQKFGAIVMLNGLEWQGTRWTKGQILAIHHRYKLLARHGRYRVYVPKG